MSQAVCAQASTILNITYFCLTTTQVEELVSLIEAMYKSSVPMMNSTYVGPNQNSAVNNFYYV